MIIAQIREEIYDYFSKNRKGATREQVTYCTSVNASSRRAKKEKNVAIARKDCIRYGPLKLHNRLSKNVQCIQYKAIKFIKETMKNRKEDQTAEGKKTTLT